MAMRTNGLIGSMQHEERKEQISSVEPLENKEDKLLELYSKMIDIFTEGYMFHSEASLKSHVFGLQGFKRMHRFMSYKDRQFVLKLQHYIIDMYGVKLDIDWKNLHIPEYDNVKDMFLNYLEYENHQYDKISNIYKEMIDYGFIYDAKLISEPLCNISKEIIKYKRYIQDFNSASCSLHHIRYIDIILHDKYKKEEAEEYNFHD